MDRGGIETFIMNVYRNIDRNNIQFDFLVHTERECAYDKEILELGGRIYRIPPRNKSILLNYLRLKSFFNIHKEYQIVHQHVSSLAYITPLLISKKYGIPVRIIHGHSTSQGGSRLNKYLHAINKRLIKNISTDRFACSILSANWTFGEQSENIKIIKNGINALAFSYNYEIRETIRNRMNLNKSFVVGHIGRFNKVKNHPFLIEVFREITKIEPSSILLLVGDGKEKGKIQAKVEEMNLSDKVMFLNSTDNVKELYQAMDTFVFPSLNEGLGIVLLEAQASGLVSYASKHVVPEEVNVTNSVNFLDLSDSPYEWAKEIVGTYSKRRSFAKEINKSGYSIESVSNKLQRFYKERLESKIEKF
jgi:glycosyltransferase involved in cell wall biosynthesis